jgi:ABC-2 type transport system permease protein
MASTPIQRTLSVAYKELLHLLRDPQTLVMALFLPIVQLSILGFAVETNVRDIPTVVLDFARTQESRALIDKFKASGDFKVLAEARSEAEITSWLRQGWARVGIQIPENYSRNLEGGRESQIQVLVDGTISAVAAQALATSNTLALRDSLQRQLGGKNLAMESRPRVLFNPDMKSANFFVPGLMIVLCQMIAVTLSANAIVREKEKGTLEQLFMTPVRPAEMILGKLSPYFVLTVVELAVISLMARVVFGVPMNGPFWVMMCVSLPFVLCMLAWGLWVSTKVETRDAAMQTAMASMMPCIFLSGYVFPLDSMPLPFWIMAQCIPTTWMVDAARAVLLRGGGWAELWPAMAVLSAMAVGAVMYTTTIFKKKLA